MEILTQLGRYAKISALRFDNLFMTLVDDKTTGKAEDIVRTEQNGGLLYARLLSLHIADHLLRFLPVHYLQRSNGALP